MVVRIYKSMHRSLFQGLTEAYVGPGAAQLLDANGQSLLGTVTTTPPAVTAAPTISGEAVEGSTLTGTVGTASGTPAPIAARQWLADGVTIAGATGASFDTTGRAGQAISLRVTWSNGTAPDAVSTSAAITVTAAPPQPVAPSAQTAPSISPATGPVGTVFTITEGTYAGTTPITIGGTLTQAGVDVIGEMSGDSFTSTAEGALVWTETASNGTAPDATQTASATVEAVAVEPVPTFARAALTSDSHSVHSGHSLTDTYTNGAIDSWPGDFANLFISQFGEAAYVYETTYRRDVIPGSTMQIRWDENPTGHARHQIGTYDTLMITEAGPLFGRPTPQNPTVSNTTLDYLLRFAENTYLNARNAPGEVILWSIWPNVEGWIGYGGPEEGAWSDLGGFRGCLPEYGRCFRFFAEYVTWKMHELHLDMPADWKIWVFPGHAWWARVYDDIQAGLVPGITDHRQLFRDDIHPNTVGEYAMAVFVYTMLYQVDCRTIDYAPPAAAVSADLDTYFKRVAWEVATAEASVGMGGTDNAAPSFDPAIHGDPLAIASGDVDPLEPVEVANLLWASSEPVVMDGATVINNDLSTSGAAGAPLYAVISFIPDALQPKSAGGVFQVRSSTGEAMMTLTYRQDLDVVVFDNGLSGSFHATHSVPDADVEAGVPITIELWIEPTATPSAHIVGPYNNNTSALTASTNPATSMRFGTPDWGGEIMAGTVHALAIFDRVPTVAQRAGLVAWAEAQFVAPEPEPATASRLAIWYDGDIDDDNLSVSSTGAISGLNETDDESALPLMLGAQDWLDIRGITCGAQEGNVAGAQQLYGAYEVDRPNLITYTRTASDFLTRAELEARTYQAANNSTGGSVNTPSRGLSHRRRYHVRRSACLRSSVHC
ncbi:MAG: hypothetical protein VYB46_11815 [Pseudomonadota bacterium]|nr:hypothetical protein [Pseudomonadota bacterium]